MFSNNLIAGAAGQSTGFYPLNIEQSLRFNDNDSAYLSRTPASAGNRKTWTWSGWVKRGNIGTTDAYILFDASTSDTNASLIEFGKSTEGDTALNIVDYQGGERIRLRTNMKFRDVSSWYHIVVAVDTTQATSTNRVKIYVNGEQITSLAQTTYPSQNHDTLVNSTNQHRFGKWWDNRRFFDGYLAEVHFVDGTAYDADAFGEFKSGVWVAKSPSVTYGTNGFYLDFANSADIGNDVSGEGNDWTPNNFTASDVVLDSPTDNFCTWNPLARNNTTYSDGNLTSVTTSNAAPYNIVSTIRLPTTGKWYAEITATVGANNPAIGIGSNVPTDQWAMYRANGTYINGGIAGISSSGTPATYVTNDVIGIAYDADTGGLSFYKNGSAQTGGFTNIPSTGYFIAIRADSASGDGGTANFGQLGFTYTPPTGYLALSTANLPEPTISPADDASPSDYFNTGLYTGDGTSNRDITGFGFDPDFNWLKMRSSADNHVLTDVLRGTNHLHSNTTDADSDISYPALTTDGFTVSGGIYNNSGETFVAWAWKANGSGVSNTDGTITSTVSANTTSGFSIVSYTGNGSTNQTVGHGLSATPDLVIYKDRDSTNQWRIIPVFINDGYYLAFDTTAMFTTSTAFFGTNTSSVLGISGSSSGIINSSGNDIIAYAFHSVEGFSKFGSYTGNGSADGPFVYTGFRPAFVMFKRSDSAASWRIIDTARETINATQKEIYPNLSNAEAGAANGMDMLSNGFKLRGSYSEWNASGGTFIFAAFAENPFKYSNAR